MGAQDDSRKGDAPKDLPLFDGGEADTVQAAVSDVMRDDLGRIDTDRQRTPSALLPRPLASDELREELSEAGVDGFSRIDTLPDGFADIL